FKNEAGGESFDLTHPGGIPEFLGRLVADSQKPAVTEQPFTLARTNGEKMEVALQWTESTDETIRSYVNGIRTSSGRTHRRGFRDQAQVGHLAPPQPAGQARRLQIDGPGQIGTLYRRG